jgi:uncharacterized protein
MSHLDDLAHRRPVAAWLALVFGIAYPVLGIVLLLRRAIPVDPVLSVLAFVLLFGGAVLVTAWADGRDGVRRLLGGLVQWRIGVARWLLVLAALPALTLAIAAATGSLRSPTGGWAGMVLGYLVPGLLAGLVSTSLWEEAGWSGLVQTRLMARHGLVRGALLTSVPFALIHVPVAFANNDVATAVVDLVAIALLAPLLRYLIGVLMFGGRGSILAAGLLHASLNASGRLPAAEGGWQVIPAVALLAIVVAVSRRVVGRAAQAPDGPGPRRPRTPAGVAQVTSGGRRADEGPARTLGIPTKSESFDSQEL